MTCRIRRRTPTMPTTPMPSIITEAGSGTLAENVPATFDVKLVVLRLQDKRDRHEAVYRVKRAFGPSSPMPLEWAIGAERCAQPSLPREVAEMYGHTTKKRQAKTSEVFICRNFPRQRLVSLSSEEQRTARSVATSSPRFVNSPGQTSEPRSENRKHYECDSGQAMVDHLKNRRRVNKPLSPIPKRASEAGSGTTAAVPVMSTSNPTKPSWVFIVRNVSVFVPLTNPEDRVKGP